MLFWKKRKTTGKDSGGKNCRERVALSKPNEWERIQYAKEIVERAVNLLDYFLEKYPHVERIGLTGQMHGIVYVDKEGNCVSSVYIHGRMPEEVSAMGIRFL